MTTLNISLTESARQFIEDQAARQGLANSSQYVERLIVEAARQTEDEEIQRKLTEGLNSGPGIVADDSYWERKAASLEQEQARMQRGE